MRSSAICSSSWLATTRRTCDHTQLRLLTDSPSVHRLRHARHPWLHRCIVLAGTWSTRVERELPIIRATLKALSPAARTKLTKVCRTSWAALGLTGHSREPHEVELMKRELLKIHRKPPGIPGAEGVKRLGDVMAGARSKKRSKLDFDDERSYAAMPGSGGRPKDAALPSMAGRFFAGTPIAVKPAGTSQRTREFAAITAPSPTFTLPMMLVLHPT